MDLAEFIASTEKTWSEAQSYAAEINALSESARVKTLSKISYINEQYVRIEDNRLIVDRNLVNMDIVNFKICRHIYRTYVNLTDELQRNGYRITRYSYRPVIEKLVSAPAARVTFKELFDEYHRLKSVQMFYSFENNEELCAMIERRHPLVKQAYEQLGVAKVQALKYHVGNIRRELVKKLPVTNEYKMVKMINDTIPKQTAIPKSKVKETLQGIYDTLGLARTAKAADLAN